MFFKYKGRNKYNELVKGEIEGNNRKEIIFKLKKSNITLICLNEIKKKSNISNNNKNKNKNISTNNIPSFNKLDKNKISNLKNEDIVNELNSLLNPNNSENINNKTKKISSNLEKLNTNISFFNSSSIKSKEIMMFSKQLSILLQTGVPLIQSLQLLSEEIKNNYFKKIINLITTNIVKGYSFSDSLKPFQKDFGSYYITMIKTGENTGKLSQMLNLLYEYLVQKEKFKKKIITASIYPCFIFSVLIIAFMIFAIKIIPNFIVLFDGQPLPKFTMFIFNLVNFIGKHIISIIIFIIAFIFLLKFLLHIPKIKFYFDKIKLKLPIWGKITLYYEIINLFQILDICLTNGISLPNSLKICINNTNNLAIKSELSIVLEEVIKGNNMSTVIKKSKIFTPLCKQMIKVGEESGKLNVTLKKTYEFYNWMLNDLLNNIEKYLEPISILIISVFVCIFVFAIFSPMISISTGETLKY